LARTADVKAHQAAAIGEVQSSKIFSTRHFEGFKRTAVVAFERLQARTVHIHTFQSPASFHAYALQTLGAFNVQLFQ
jgi:hypothetical protein